MPDNISNNLKQTQTKLLKHHGGNGYRAQQAILNSYENRHDTAFWQFWESDVACAYAIGDAIVDLGAGAGQFVRDCANRYPQSQVFGVDAADYMLKSALRLPNNAQLILDDLSNPQISLTEISENSCAMIMANTLVHELAQPIKMFKAVYRWLKPGGRFCVIEGIRQPLSAHINKRFTRQQIWSDKTGPAELETAFDYYFEHNQYLPEDLEFLLTECGFTLIKNEQIADNRLMRIVVEKPTL